MTTSTQTVSDSPPSGPATTQRKGGPSRGQLAVAGAVVFLPTAAVAWTLAGLPATAPGALDLCLLAGFYLLTMFGVEGGFHRFVSHGSYVLDDIPRALLVVAGSMAAEGPVLFWAATHRAHHAYSDLPGDPHSPRLHGDHPAGVLRGLWHGHAGWLFASPPASWARFAPDLVKDSLLFRLNQLYPAWVLLGLVLPGSISGLAAGTWHGFWQGLIWGGLIRIFLVHQATWSVNSLCHRYGSRPYRIKGTSTNNGWLALTSLGGSWHNNHHAFPMTADNGFEWWQLDLSGLAIRAAGRLGLARDLKVPSPEARTSRRGLADLEPAID